MATPRRRSSRHVHGTKARPLVELLEPRIVYAAGDPDPSFHGNGSNFADFFTFSLIDHFTAVVQQADGKIVAVGSSTDFTTTQIVANPTDDGPLVFETVDLASRDAPDLIVARFNADGSLDTTFGDHGQVRLDFGGLFLSKEQAFAVAMDGTNIVIGGRSAEANTVFDTTITPVDYDVTVVRLNSAGALDGTFGTGGFTRVDFGSTSEQVNGLAVLPDHSIVATGTTGEDVFVAKFTAAGALDPTFGTGGKTITDFGGSDQANAVLIDGSGRIVIAGSDGTHFAAARYTATGAPDSTFGSSGIEIISSLPSASANALTLDAQNDILLAGGATQVNSIGQFALVRLTPSGQLDTGFNGTGIALHSFFGGIGYPLQQAQSVAIDGSGRIDLTGQVLTSGGIGILAAARFLATGAPDMTFGSGGIVLPDFGGDESGGAGILDSQGHLLVVGETVGLVNGMERSDAAIARITSRGTLDTTWGGTGLVTTDYQRGSDAEADVAALQPDGKVIIGGSTHGGFSGADFALVRFNADGSIDQSFGVDGRVVTDFGSGAKIMSLIVEPDNSIIAAGPMLGIYGIPEIAVAHYTANGALDTSFNGTGTWISGIHGAVYDSFGGMALQPDGNLVIAGTEQDYYSGIGSSLLLRLKPDGTLDPAFGTNGIEIHSVTGADAVTAVHLQPDGRILVGGFVSHSTLLERFNADGTVDSTFGKGGATITTYGDGGLPVQGLELLGDGSIMVSGTFVATVSGPLTIGLEKFTSAGLLDTSFGDVGRTLIDLGAYFPEIETAGLITFESNGDLLIGGDSTGILRLLPNGTPDIHFGDNGFQAISISGETFGASVGILERPTGQLVIAGRTFTIGPTTGFGIAQLLTAAPSSPEGVFSVTAPTTSLFPSAGQVVVTVQRSGGTTGAVDVPYSTVAESAQPGTEFTPTSGTLHFQDGQTSLTITIPLTLDNIGKPAETFRVVLGAPTNGGVADNPQSEEIVLRAHSGASGSFDPSFGTDGYGQIDAYQDLGAGGNALNPVQYFSEQTVNELIRMPDGRYLTIGNSVSTDGEQDFILAMFHADGTPDTTFGDGGGVRTNFAGDSANAQFGAVLPNGDILVEGTVIETVTPGANAAVRVGLARYLPDGQLDQSFGVQGFVIALHGGLTSTVGQGLALLPNGQFLVSAIAVPDSISGGVGSQAVGGVVARFNADGSVDTTFGNNGALALPALNTDPGFVPLLLQSNGDFIVAEQALNAKTKAIDTDLLRYLPSGKLDLSFGKDGIAAIPNSNGDGAIQLGFTADGKIFGMTGLVLQTAAVSEFFRLTATGQLDTTFNGTGTAYAPASEYLNHFALLPDDSFAVSGSSGGERVVLKFTSNGAPDPTFGIAGVAAVGGLEPVGNLDLFSTGIVVNPDNSIVTGFDGLLTSDTSNHSKITLVRQLPGPAPAEFDVPVAVQVDENAGNTVITVTRHANTVGEASVDYSLSAGTAMAGTDFTAVSGTLSFADGQSSAQIVIPILDVNFPAGQKTFTLNLANPEGGATIGADGSTAITIFNGPGTIAFDAPTFAFTEGGRQVSVPVERTGGSDGVVHVHYAFQDGTAKQGEEYSGSNGTVTFADGQSSASIIFYLLDDHFTASTESFSLSLANPARGTLGAQSTTLATIYNNSTILTGGEEGALDGTFGTNGLAQAPAGLGSAALAYKEAIESDGSIVVVGATGGIESDVVVVHYLPNGTLDPHFGQGGMVTIDFGGADVASSVAITPDNKIVFAGWTVQNGRGDFAIGRLNADGSLDTTFNGTGKETLDFSQQDDRANDVGVTAAGQIVVVGSTANLTVHELAVARFNPDGSLDKTFNGDGKATYDFAGRYEYGGSLAFTPDGKIVIAGSSSTDIPGNATVDNAIDTRVVVARLLSNGALDKSFHTTGYELGPDDNLVIGVEDVNVLVRPNGNIVVTANIPDFAKGNNGNAFYKFEYLPDGTVDGALPSYGGAGNSILIDFGVDDVLHDAVLGADGSIYFADSNDGQLAVVQFEATGYVATDFGGGGIATLGILPAAEALALTPQGDLIALGADFSVAKLHGTAAEPPQGAFAIGTPEVTVNEFNNGFAYIAIARPLHNSSGRVVVDYTVLAGTAQAGVNFTPITGSVVFEDTQSLASLEIPILYDPAYTGNLDFTVLLTGASGGAEISPFRTATVTIEDHDTAAPVTNNGDFSGLSFTPDIVLKSAGIALVTVSRLGSTTGTVTIDYATVDGTAKAGEDYTPQFGTLTFGPGVTSEELVIGILPNTDLGSTDFFLEYSNPGGGAITGSVVSHEVVIPDGDSFTFVNAGTVDTGFGATGSVSTALGAAGTGAEYITHLVPLANGEFYAIGQGGATAGFGVAKYHADGTLDTSFGSGGKVVTNVGAGGGLAESATVQPDGKLEVIGAAQSGAHQLTVLVRYNTDGTLDKTFGKGGIATYDFGDHFQAFTNFAATPDGKLVAAGDWFNGIDGGIVLTRFNSDGTLDSTFGVGGIDTYDLSQGGERMNSIAVQPDGKILVDVLIGTQPTALVRFNSDGTLDTSVGNHGIVNYDFTQLYFPGSTDRTGTVGIGTFGIDPSGKIYFAGFDDILTKGSTNPADEVIESFVARLNPDLTVDTSYANQGIAELPTAASFVQAFGFDQDGRVYLAGYTGGVLRLTRTGVMDIGFGGNAAFTTPAVPGEASSTVGEAFDIFVQSDGAVVVGGGTKFTIADSDFMLERFEGGPAAGYFRLISISKNVAENSGSLVVEVERVGGFDGAASIDLATLDGSAVAGVKYGGVNTTLNWGDLQAGIQTVTIPIIDNNIADGNEDFNIQLSNASEGTIDPLRATEHVTIIDNEVPGEFDFHMVQYKANESDGSVTIEIDRLGGHTGPASVTIGTAADSTATLGANYTFTPETLNFADGQTSQFVTIGLIDNSLAGTATVHFVLSDPSTGTTLGFAPEARLTIIDDDLPPAGTFDFGSAHYVANETDSGIVVTVYRHGGSAGAATVNIATQSGTATVYNDFAPVIGTLLFADGQTQKSIFIPVIDDLSLTSNVTFTVELSSPTGSQIGSNVITPTIGLGQTTVEIANDNVAPVLTLTGAFAFTKPTVSVVESQGVAHLVVTRFGAVNSAASVDVQLTAGTATAGADFTATTIHLDFGANDTVAVADVPIRRDFINEKTETFTATLVNPAGAALGAQTTTTVSILDDDTSPLADFNNDGLPDLVLLKGGKLYVHLNTGAGTFETVSAANQIILGIKAITGFVVGDFNGDGNADIAVLSAAKKTITILPGHGDGTFGTPVSFASGPKKMTAKKELIVGDFNEDGLPDLAAVSAKGINVLLNTSAAGSLSFATPVVVAAGKALGTLMAGDFNGNGHTDFAITNGGSRPAITLLEGNGLGDFASEDISPLAKGAKQVFAADLNDDGILDIAALFPKNRIGYQLGGAGGFFGVENSFLANKGSKLLATGDFNDDLNLDLVTTTAKKIADIIVSQGGGRFAAPVVLPTGFNPTTIIATDMNDDGDIDLVLWNKKNQFTVFLGAGDTTFAT